MSRTPLPSPGPETRLARLVTAVDANFHGTLHGGVAMRLMDEAGAVAAGRYTRADVVTAHIDALDFRRPVPLGSLVEAIARVIAVGRTSVEVEVRLESEDRYTGVRTITTTGSFVFVAIDADGRPLAFDEVPSLIDHPI